MPKAQTKKAATKRATRRTRRSSSPARASRRARGSKRRLDIEALREMLVAERARVFKELEEMQARTARRSRLDSAVEEQDFDDNPGDAATETLERGTDMALERNVHEILEQLDHALEKVEAGTYGVCDSCGCEIPELRLKALPYATLCLDCQDKIERA